MSLSNRRQWPRPFPEILGFKETWYLAFLRSEAAYTELSAEADRDNTNVERIHNLYQAEANEVVAQLPLAQQSAAQIGLRAVQAEIYRRGDWFGHQQVALQDARQLAEQLNKAHGLNEALDRLSRHAILGVVFEIVGDFDLVDAVARITDDQDIVIDAGQILAVLNEEIEAGSDEARMVLFEEQFLDLLRERNIIE